MFRHRTTSPYHSQANCLVESAVKTAKSLLRTAIKAGEDPWLAILTYRNTPTQGMETSPVQRLMSRQTKTLLPMDEKHLEPAVTVSTDSVQLQQRLHKQKAHYDQSHGTKELPELNSGDIVRVRPMLLGQQEWEEAIVVEKHSEPRSYNVRTRTGILRRNRRDLVKQRGGESEPPVEPSGEQRNLSKDKEEDITEEAQGENIGQQPTVCRRSSRRCNPPDRYGDWDIST